MKNILAKQENIELILKGYNDYNPYLLKDAISSKGEDMPVKLIKGSLRYREDLNVYESRVTINYKQKSFYSKDKVECIKKANTFYKNNYKKLTIQTNKNNLLFSDWVEQWLNLYKLPYLKKTSIPTTLSAVNKYILPYFKKYKLNDINALAVDKFLNTLTNSRHKETVCTTICDCLGTAYKKEVLKKPVHQQIKKYKHEREEGHCLTIEEERTLLDNLVLVPNSQILYFVYLTGCRKHGALNLEPSDIDFKNKKIHLRETKTKTSDRFFPLTDELEYFLSGLDLTKEKVFTLSDRQLKNMINEISMRCGFRVKIKDLRTTFSSRAREKGITPEVLKKWLGHSSYEITEKYYVKISNTFEAEQTKLLNKIYTTQNTTQKK